MTALFFFDLVCDDEEIRDDGGVEARDLDQALADAQDVIAEMGDELAKEFSGRPWALIVRDDSGAPVGRLPITR